MRKIETVLKRLDNVKPSGDEQWTARCPAHQDRQNSLAIGVGKTGKVLLHCFRGCKLRDILSQLKLKSSDLFEDAEPPRKNKRAGPRRKKTEQKSEVAFVGCTLEEYAEAKKLSVDFLKNLGLRDQTYQGTTAVRIPYLDATGNEDAVRYRVGLNKNQQNDQRFRWKKASKVSLYGLWRLPEAKKKGYVVLVEGESDCHALWSHDIPAIGIPGANLWRDEREAVHLDDIPKIYVVIEPDQGGETLKQRLAQSRLRDRIHFINFGKFKDPSALHIDDPERFLERWQTFQEQAVSLSAQEAEEARANRDALWRQCKAIARRENILDLFAQAIEAAGVVGEVVAKKLLFLILVSRLLTQPINATVKGPSSAGKSYLLKKVLEFFPQTAFYALSSASERALIYSEEPFQHRFIVLYEATGLGEFGLYLMRTLLSEGHLIHETVESTTEGFKPVRIEKEGPTGFLTTTTAIKLHDENDTRSFDVLVTDTPEQTAKILTALAAEAEHQRIEPDKTIWINLQLWLESTDHQVTIPYARALARKIPPLAVRLRRDFGAILNLIRAHAVLQQACRRRDDQGCIIATLDDYEVVRELVADTVGAGVEATVPKTIKETVHAVKVLLGEKAGKGAFAEGVGDEVSLTEVAEKLQLDKTASSRRVKHALAKNYLQNLEEKRGKTMRLILGEALPQDKKILPTRADLEQSLFSTPQNEGADDGCCTTVARGVATRKSRKINRVRGPLQCCVKRRRDPSLL